MRTKTALALAAARTIGGIGSEVLSACGDKFLPVGRGVSAQHAYAAVHPASILIVLPSKDVKSAAVRDSHLRSALRNAGHRVETVQQPADLAGILERSPYAIVLAERADIRAVQAAASAALERPAPSIIAVLEDPSSADLTDARPQVDYVLRTPQPALQILNMLDDVMKGRLEGARR